MEVSVATRQYTRSMPYKLMMILLYGQHSWIDRNNSTVVVPITLMSKHMRTRASKIHESLELLQTWGFISFKWYKYHANVSIVPPQGMAFTVGPIDKEVL